MQYLFELLISLEIVMSSMSLYDICEAIDNLALLVSRGYNPLFEDIHSIIDMYLEHSPSFDDDQAVLSILDNIITALHDSEV